MTFSWKTIFEKIVSEIMSDTTKVFKSSTTFSSIQADSTIWKCDSIKFSDFDWILSKMSVTLNLLRDREDVTSYFNQLQQINWILSNLFELKRILTAAFQ